MCKGTVNVLSSAFPKAVGVGAIVGLVIIFAGKGIAAGIGTGLFLAAFLLLLMTFGGFVGAALGSLIRRIDGKG